MTPKRKNKAEHQAKNKVDYHKRGRPLRRFYDTHCAAGQDRRGSTKRDLQITDLACPLSSTEDDELDFPPGWLNVQSLKLSRQWWRKEIVKQHPELPPSNGDEDDTDADEYHATNETSREEDIAQTPAVAAARVLKSSRLTKCPFPCPVCWSITR